MKLDKGLLSFNISIDEPANTLAWGTLYGPRKVRDILSMTCQ